ncbi:DUF6086 family protein [Streptomyces rhizosphaerihabitans]|uniref:DUF6086 family protein n=1 Tax=Streptomyces rhizosphaerihabitans TaxID=1266770 RepID=UPI0021C15A5B|nr:DUF6086 family protein [Streptomyces rhizosphaerihabitans]MCT9008780.1 DUF6086 family protein [Streptomyces rhizosphaerihabitans]
MSMYFELGDETLWNPSNGAGRLFLRQVEVFEAELGLPSGIGQGRHWGDPGTREVEPALYAEFVHGLVAWHCRTGHSVILALSEGFAATAVALARRAGIEVVIPEPEAGHVGGGARYDVQVPGNPRPTPAAVAGALDMRAREMDRAMAR